MTLNTIYWTQGEHLKAQHTAAVKTLFFNYTMHKAAAFPHLISKPYLCDSIFTLTVIFNSLRLLNTAASVLSVTDVKIN